MSKARKKGSERVFDRIKKEDVQILKQAATASGIEARVTWHGFRRGRTTDLVTCRGWGEHVSIMDIFESGGWAVGSRAVFKYLSEEAQDNEKMVSNMSAASDTE